MSNLPDSIKVDSSIKDDYYKNYNAYKMSSLNEADDYICVLENVGVELPELILGLGYRFATSKSQRKDICENKFRKPNSEAGIYIRRDDWISKDDDLQCGVFKSEDELMSLIAEIEAEERLDQTLHEADAKMTMTYHEEKLRAGRAREIFLTPGSLLAFRF